jgi:hypothetical protein
MRHFAQLESDDLAVGVHQGVHVAVETCQEIYCLNLKLQLDEVVRVC